MASRNSPPTLSTLDCHASAGAASSAAGGAAGAAATLPRLCRWLGRSVDAELRKKKDDVKDGVNLLEADIDLW